MAKRADSVLPACNANGNNVSIVGIMKKRISVVDGSIYRIRIDVLEVRLILRGAVGDLPVWTELYKTILIAFVFYEDWPIGKICVS